MQRKAAGRLPRWPFLLLGVILVSPTETWQIFSCVCSSLFSCFSLAYLSLLKLKVFVLDIALPCEDLTGLALVFEDTDGPNAGHADSCPTPFV